MADPRSEAADLIAERPEVESDLRELLDADDGADGWTFEDVSLDSGTFGEVVSRGLVVETDDGNYRVADRAALAAALDGEAVDADADGPTDRSDDGSTSTDGSTPGVPAPRVDRRSATALLAALAVFLVLRVASLGSVFRDGDVVLLANDPYFYRWLTEQYAAAADHPLDVGAVTELGGGAARGEPLLVAVLGGPVELLGGGADASGTVLAWYPLLAGVAGAVLVYSFATRVAGDRRVGVAAVGALAVVPIHAARTAVGFADHHAFDYAWLALTALALVAVLSTADRPARDRWPWVVALGVGIAGQVLSWQAGLLLVAPVGLVAVVRSLSDLRAGEAPLRSVGGVAAGGLLAAAVVALVHVLLNWHSTTVAVAPALLAVGLCGVAAVGELAHRRDWPTRVVGGVYAVLAAGGLVAAVTVVPEVGARLLRGGRRLAGTTGVVEGQSLLSAGVLVNLGPAALLAAPYLLVVPWLLATDSAESLPGGRRWIVPVTYAWYLLVLAVVQVRFAGELAPVIAPLAGLALVRMAAWLDVARPLVRRTERGRPTAADGGDADDRADGNESETIAVEWPGTRPAVYLGVLWLVIAAPGMAVAAGTVDGVSYGPDRYAAATAIDEYADDAGVEWPRSYVLSRWDHNRMYNYHASGQSRSYVFARQVYPELLGATNASRWYESTRRPGFVVVERAGDAPEETLQSRLLAGYGDRPGDPPALANFRVIWVDEDGDLAAYRLVRGAVVAGRAPAGSTVTVSTTVRVPDAQFTYERRVRATGGTFRVVVAYPGEYEVGNRTVSVAPAAVEDHRRVETGLVDPTGREGPDGRLSAPSSLGDASLPTGSAAR